MSCFFRSWKRQKKKGMEKSSDDFHRQRGLLWLGKWLIHLLKLLSHSCPQESCLKCKVQFLTPRRWGCLRWCFAGQLWQGQEIDVKNESWCRTQLSLQTGGDSKVGLFMPQCPIARWGWGRSNQSPLRELGNETQPRQGSPSKAEEFELLMVWDWLWAHLSRSSSAPFACLSVLKDKLLLRSGICFFFTLKTKGAPLTPFTMSHCYFTWNCCACLPRKWDEIKLRGIYLFAFWAGMCSCLFCCFCSWTSKGHLKEGMGTQQEALVCCWLGTRELPTWVTISQGLSGQKWLVFHVSASHKPILPLSQDQPKLSTGLCCLEA